MAVTREDIIVRIKAVGADTFRKSMDRMGQTVKKMKFEWLGVMFAGMALQRVFGGLIRKQMELFGVTKMLSAAWTVVLLPIMDLLVPILMRLLDLFINMPESMKFLIGSFVLFGFVLGTTLAIVGQLVLGLGSLAIVFGTSIKLIVTSFGTIFAWFGLIVLAIFGIITAVKNWGKDWSKVFKGIGFAILGIGGIFVMIFGGWIPVLITAVLAGFSFLLSWLSNKFPKISDFFQKWFYEKPKLWIGKIWDYIKGFFKWIGSKITGPFNFIGSLFGGGKNSGVLGSFATGGIIPKTGPYLMHAGESVTPSNQVNSSSPTIIINANLSNDVDIDRLADKLKRHWVEDFERVSQGRST